MYHWKLMLNDVLHEDNKSVVALLERANHVMNNNKVGTWVRSKYNAKEIGRFLGTLKCYFMDESCWPAVPIPLCC